MRKVLIIGATSAIAGETARLFAADGQKLFLVARDIRKLEALADDLSVRGAAQVEICQMDALDFQRHRSVIEEARMKLGGLDAALIAHGTLADQAACETSFELTQKEMQINLLSVISLLTHLSAQFEQQRQGTLAVISSVAGDRGRQSNYVYGSAKGAVSIFLEGLRNRLHKSGVHVLTIKPGFVDTPMTANFGKGFLWAQPSHVAKDIHRAMEGNDDVLFSPWFWRWIMLVIRLIPESIFKRLSL